MASPSGFGRWIWLWSIGYALLLAAIVWSMFAARDWARTNLSTAESGTAWQAWRDDVRESQEHPSPVQRRVPKSAEPPALVLTRDYFAVLLGGAVFFSSLLYWVIAWFVTGIVSPRQDAAAI